MHARHWLALGAFAAALFVTEPAHSQFPTDSATGRQFNPQPAARDSSTSKQFNRPERPEDKLPLPQKIAKLTNLTEEQVTRVLLALGPAVRDDLSRGKTVTLPGLGTFRVVQVAAHRDMGINDSRKARPVDVPAVNRVEFLPAGETNAAANTGDARPTETVPEFKYVPLPNQTPGQKTPGQKVPSTRIR